MLRIGRGAEVTADLAVQSRAVDIQRAIADAVLWAAEHHHAQLAPAAHVRGGHHVLIHQLGRVKAQAPGIGGPAQRMRAGGAAAVVDEQYVVVGFYRRPVRLRRLGKAGPGR